MVLMTLVLETGMVHTAAAAVEPLVDIDCSRQAGELPHPGHPVGERDPSIPIKHVVVLMQENHSFDNYLGALAQGSYAGQVDGIEPGMTAPRAGMDPIAFYHQPKLCVRDPDHDWEAMHYSWDHGLLDQFFQVNTDRVSRGARVFSYYDANDLPFYYALADRFAIADRYFCSALAGTVPNRFFLMAGTAWGYAYGTAPWLMKDPNPPTVYSRLNDAHVSWRVYFSEWTYASMFTPFFLEHIWHFAPLELFDLDARAGNLPEVSFIELPAWVSDEHPPGDVQLGQAVAAARIRSLVNGKSWPDSVLFLTYDEGGGYYDHVPPPKACKPDDSPMVYGSDNDQPGDFDQLGSRVPFIAVSPFVKHHYVSHEVYDHTSVLRFLEQKFNLPFLSRRDANSNTLLDLFDFDHPDFDRPKLPKDKFDVKQAAECALGHVQN
jgi:phospholipase C